MDNPVVTCSCGLAYDHNGWLQLAGAIVQSEGCPAGAVLMLRKCVCGSHIARAVGGTGYLTAAEYAAMEARDDR
jgi:hypothetical protein